MDAYDSDETGRFEVYVQPFMRPGARITVSLAGGTQVRWSDDFKELFYIAPDSHLSWPFRSVCHLITRR
jgi:hypothetical protein